MDLNLSTLPTAVPASVSCCSNVRKLHSASPLDLAPILDIRARTLSNDSLSLPTSDNLLNFLPTFLEPIPIFNCDNYSKVFHPHTFTLANESLRSPSPFSSLSSSPPSSQCSSFSPSLPSTLYNDSSPMSYHRKLSEGTTIPLDSNVFDGHEHLQYLSVKKHTSNSTLIKTSDRYNQLGSDINRQPVTSTKIDPSYKPLSPTMLAAFTVATTALSDTRDYSLPFIADEYQKSFDFNTSTNKKSCIKRGGIKSDKDTIGKTSSAIVDRGISNDGKSFKIRSSKGHGKKRSSSNIHQNMFLTKNAHIKRPRNAWIHFRCHYGQALKFQDPTLRAEEISKQASFKWAKLSEKGKKPWHDLAQQEKKVHKEAFPDYRYRPRRSSAVTVTSATIQSRKKN